MFLQAPHCDKLCSANFLRIKFMRYILLHYRHETDVTLAKPAPSLLISSWGGRTSKDINDSPFLDSFSGGHNKFHMQEAQDKAVRYLLPTLIAPQTKGLASSTYISWLSDLPDISHSLLKSG